MAPDVTCSPNSDAVVWGSSDQKIVQSVQTNSKQCVGQPVRRLTQTRSVHWWESPRVVAKWMLTFDSAALYPQLWINDSKRPYPRGLMCSARLQTQAESRQSEKCDIDDIQSYNDWYSKCWISSLNLESLGIRMTKFSHLVPTEQSEMS